MARQVTQRDRMASNSDLSEIISREASSYKKSKTLHSKVVYLGDDLVRAKAAAAVSSGPCTPSPMSPRTEVLIVAPHTDDEEQEKNAPSQNYVKFGAK